MTVKELIEELENYDDNLEVTIRVDGLHGSVNKNEIRKEENELIIIDTVC